MKIILPEHFFNTALLKPRIFNVKVLEIKSASTMILIKGKQLEVPYVLNKNTVYTAQIDQQILYLTEKINHKPEMTEQMQNKKLLEDFISKLLDRDHSDHQNVAELKNFPFYNFYQQVMNEDDEKRNKFFQFTQSGDNAFIFIFNLPFFNENSRIFLKINRKKELVLYINAANCSKAQTDFFSQNLKNSLKQKINTIIVNIINNQDEFNNNVNLLINHDRYLDLKI